MSFQTTGVATPATTPLVAWAVISGPAPHAARSREHTSAVCLRCLSAPLSSGPGRATMRSAYSVFGSDVCDAALAFLRRRAFVSSPLGPIDRGLMLDLLADCTRPQFTGPTAGLGNHHLFAGADGVTSSVITLKPASVHGPNEVTIATSVASRPRAIRMRPMRGTLFRGSKVYHRPPR